MAFISLQDRETLRRRFAQELQQTVKLRLFTLSPSGLTVPGRDCQYCPETQQLLQELVELSPKLELEVLDIHGHQEEATALGVERIPAIILGTNGQGNLKYYGLPAGYEFATILDTIFNLSRGQSPLKPETREKVRAIDQDVHIQVFVTPT